MNPGRIILYIISAILFGLFWVSGGDEIRDYLPYYVQRATGQTVQVEIQGTVIRSEVARSTKAKARGLSHRQNLPTGKGMLFQFDAPGVYEFWMKDMRIAIDIVWINDGKIVDISRTLAPPLPGQEPQRVRPAAPATDVLELASGRSGTWQVGDAVSMKDDKPLFLP